MKSRLYFTFFMYFFLFNAALFSQSSPVGLWKTIDDNTGEAKSYVEIVEKDGKIYGHISKLLTKAEDTICEKCPGDKKNKMLIGMEVLWELRPHKDYWSYGKIMDPETGKTYKCSIWVEGDTLSVRGYLGISLMGRTQEWFRVN